MTSKKTIHNSAGYVLRTVEVFTSTATTQEIAICRKELGLPALNSAVRNCLRCGENFNSEGSHNRICSYCKVDFATLPCSLSDYCSSEYRSIRRRESEWRKNKGGQSGI